MNNFRKSSGLAILSIVCALLGTGIMNASAATTPSLSTAASYAILSDTYTNTLPGTTINGDIGFTTPPALVPAGLHTNYGSGAPYAAAGIVQATTLAALDAQPCTFTFAPGAIDLSTDITHGPVGVYPPGVYCSTGAMNVGGPLTLTGNGTYIFRPVGALTSTAGATVVLAGASSCDIFWTPTQATTLAANTTFFGTVITNAGVTVGANTTWLGRALAFGGTVTTDTTTMTAPICATLNIAKTVVNDNGGVATAGLFNLHVLNGGIDVAGSPAIGVVAPGRAYSLEGGAYTVSEDAAAGYTTTISGDCAVDGTITLASGEERTCTVTNNDIAAPLPASINVVKTVINDNGRTKTSADFPLFVNGVPVVSGITNVFPAPLAYTVTETVDPNYTQSFSGDCSALGVINLVPGDSKFCIITNNDNPVPGASGSGGGGYGGSAVPVPPLIDVLKVPSPLALPNGPGEVTYTYTLRNVGTVPVTNVTMVGDSCSPIVLVSGDTNNDSILDVTETWVHRCTTVLTETHTNNVVASGWANGLNATDIASATVTVGTSIVPPLIHVEKTPSRATLPFYGGWIAYSEKITNPGTVPLNNVTLNDDKCSPVRYGYGDTNRDGKLDTNEEWVYTCRSYLESTTTNTAIATGTANGVTVRDFAIATVVVASTTPVVSQPNVPVIPIVTPVVPAPVIPKLPKTGFPSVKDVKAVLPINIKIPTINVDAMIEKVGVAKDGSMAVPRSHLNAGWFGLGTLPGEIGSAVMAGHLNWVNDANGVFVKLHKLLPGDKISVEDENGDVVNFVVQKVRTYKASADATEIFSSKDDKAHLNLITCFGVWSRVAQQYTQRLVVFADKE